MDSPTLAIRQDAQTRVTMTTPLISLLNELSEVVNHLSDERYSRKPVGVVESSVGAHVRHCLDHVRSLLNAVETGELNYDHRQRGTAVESSRKAAIRLIDSLVTQLLTLPESSMDEPLRMKVMMCCDGEPLDVLTSLGREIAYVLAHTIHHNALIAAMVKTLDGWLPDRFGYAPSTVQYMKGRACVR